jgi:hypothetical protein
MQDARHKMQDARCSINAALIGRLRSKVRPTEKITPARSGVLQGCAIEMEQNNSEQMSKRESHSEEFCAFDGLAWCFSVGCPGRGSAKRLCEVDFLPPYNLAFSGFTPIPIIIELRSKRLKFHARYDCFARNHENEEAGS